MGDDLFLVESEFIADYLKDMEEEGANPRKKRRNECPGMGCRFVGSQWELRGHWGEVHQPQVLLWLCPIPDCRYVSQREGTMTSHWVTRHKFSRDKVRALEDLPSLVQLVDNRKFCDPGRDVVALTAPETEPWGALGHSAKGSLRLEVERALRATVPVPSHLVAHHPGPAPCSSQNVVEPSPAPTLLRLVPSQEGQGTVFPLISSTPSTASSEAPAPLCPTATLPVIQVTTQSPLISTEAPCAYSEAPAPLRPTAALPVVQGTTQSPLISAEDPGIVEITRLASSPKITLPPALPSSPAARQVVIEEPQPDNRSPAELSGYSPVVVLDSSPSASVKNSNSPASPSQDTNHDAAIQRVSPSQCSQPRSTGASPQVLPREEKPPQLSAKALRGQVRSLDISMERLQKLRREAMENANEAHKLEMTEKMEELHLLRRRVAFLENEMERAARGNQNNPTTVGHLQRIGSTRAYVLFPNVGQTAVYSLTSADLAMLDLRNRSEALSCEPL